VIDDILTFGPLRKRNRTCRTCAHTHARARARTHTHTRTRARRQASRQADRQSPRRLSSLSTGSHLDAVRGLSRFRVTSRLRDGRNLLAHTRRFRTSWARDEAGPGAKRIPSRARDDSPIRRSSEVIVEVQPPRGPGGEERRFMARPQRTSGAR